jgi:hypothetical protein
VVASDTAQAGAVAKPPTSSNPADIRRPKIVFIFIS